MRSAKILLDLSSIELPINRIEVGICFGGTEFHLIYPQLKIHPCLLFCFSILELSREKSKLYEFAYKRTKVVIYIEIYLSAEILNLIYNKCQNQKNNLSSSQSRLTLLPHLLIPILSKTSTFVKGKFRKIQRAYFSCLITIEQLLCWQASWLAQNCPC